MLVGKVVAVAAYITAIAVDDDDNVAKSLLDNYAVDYGDELMWGFNEFLQA